MATTKFYLDLRGKAKDGKGTILINISHNRTVTSVSTGVRIKKSEWDGTKIVRNPDAALYNAQISQKKSELDRAIAAQSFAESFGIMTASELKRTISIKSPQLSRPSITKLFKEYTSRDMTDGTREIYKLALDKVLKFSGKDISIDSIDLKWLYDFEQFLAKTQTTNGRSIYLRSLRAVCNYAFKTKATTSYPFLDFHIKSEPTRKRSVEVEKLREFKTFPVDSRKEFYRDYFFMLFYLIGVNIIDLVTAEKSAVVNGRFEYIRHKTHKLYSIKIEPELQELLDKHRGEKYLLDALDNYSSPIDFSHKMNKMLKKIGPAILIPDTNKDGLFQEQLLVKKIEPIIPKISTYYARHTWATFAHEIDIPIDTISQALGHSASNRTTLIYIRFDQDKVDAANRAVIDYFLDTQ